MCVIVAFKLVLQLHLALESTDWHCDSRFQNGKAVKEPEFSKLTYADAGVYECEVSMTGLTRRQRFELAVEGECVCFRINSSVGLNKWNTEKKL